jgi:hypothetical protein
MAPVVGDNALSSQLTTPSDELAGIRVERSPVAHVRLAFLSGDREADPTLGLPIWIGGDAHDTADQDHRSPDTVVRCPAPRHTNNCS